MCLEYEEEKCVARTQSFTLATTIDCGHLVASGWGVKREKYKLNVSWHCQKDVQKAFRWAFQCAMRRKGDRTRVGCA